MPTVRIAALRSLQTSTPATRTVPSSGATSPAISRDRVVLPDPLRPTMPIRRSRSDKVTSRSAVRGPNRQVTPLIWISGRDPACAVIALRLRIAARAGAFLARCNTLPAADWPAATQALASLHDDSIADLIKVHRQDQQGPSKKNGRTPTLTSSRVIHAFVPAV